jgi:6-phosphogluconate dehydrogenase
MMRAPACAVASRLLLALHGHHGYRHRRPSAGNANVARRLARGGVNVFGFDAEGRAATLADEKILIGMPTAVALARALSAPRVVWLDVAPGFDTEVMIQDIWPELAAGDVIVDAGGTRYQDAQRRAAASPRPVSISSIARSHRSRTIRTMAMSRLRRQSRGGADRGTLCAGPGTDRGWLHCGPEGRVTSWR